MKKYIAICLFTVHFSMISAQIIGGGGIIKTASNPNALAILNLIDQTKNGNVAIDTTNGNVYVYDVTKSVGSRWVNLENRFQPLENQRLRTTDNVNFTGVTVSQSGLKSVATASHTVLSSFINNIRSFQIDDVNSYLQIYNQNAADYIFTLGSTFLDLRANLTARNFITINSSLGGKLNLTSHGLAGYASTPITPALNYIGYADRVMASIKGLDRQVNYVYGGLTFSTANSTGAETERMRIEGANGNLLIGTTNDDGTTKLQVNGTVSATAATANNHLITLAQGDGKYLGINATAANSALLGGNNATYYQNAENITAGILNDNRLSGNVLKLGNYATYLNSVYQPIENQRLRTTDDVNFNIVRTLGGYFQAGADGKLIMSGGDATFSGFLQIIRANGQRAAYIGFVTNTGDVNYTSENGANHRFQGGSLNVDNAATVGGILTASNAVRINTTGVESLVKGTAANPAYSFQDLTNGSKSGMYLNASNQLTFSSSGVARMNFTTAGFLNMQGTTRITNLPLNATGSEAISAQQVEGSYGSKSTTLLSISTGTNIYNLDGEGATTKLFQFDLSALTSNITFTSSNMKIGEVIYVRVKVKPSGIATIYDTNFRSPDDTQYNISATSISYMIRFVSDGTNLIAF